MNYIPFNNFSVDRLGEDDLSSFYEAQKLVLDTLVAEFIEYKDRFKLRSKTELSDHLKSGMPILGIRKGGRIVATTMLIFPDKYKHTRIRRKAIGGYPLGNLDKSDMTIMQGVSVAPDMRGRGLTSEIFYKAAEVSIEQERQNLVAKVDAGNQKSIAMFRRYGFELFHTKRNPRTHKTDLYFVGDAFRVWLTVDHQKRNLPRPFAAPKI